MNRCADLAPLLAERASGPLAREDAAAVAAHLDGCAACRAAASRLERLLADVRAPAASDIEERQARALPARVQAAIRPAPERRPLLAWGLGLGAAAVAGALLGTSVPSALRRGLPGAPVLAAADHAPAAGHARPHGAAAAAEEEDEELLWELGLDLGGGDDLE